MPLALSSDAISRLAAGGVTMNLKPGTRLPDESIFEPPCSLKWMEVQHSLHLGAFSYGVSGYYYGCRIGRYCSFGEEVQIGDVVGRLQAVAKNNPERRIFVRGDKDLAYGRIMEVMGTITQGGFSKVALLAEQAGNTPKPPPAPAAKPTPARPKAG